MKRIELEQKEVFVVSRADYEEDRKRGFTVLEYAPKQTVTHHNPRNRDHVITRELPAVHMFRCMRCQFDVVESDYTPDLETKQPRTGMDIMRKHMDQGQHPWPYNAFETPYGNVQDVKIEGVDDYTKEQ